MYKKFLWTIIFVSAFMLNQMVFADSSVCRESLSKMVQSVNLDDGQKAKVKSILDQLKSNLKASGSQMHDLDTQLTEQVNSSNMDQDKANGLVDQQTKLIGDMIKARIMATNQIFSILNPQQKEKLQAMIKKSEEKVAAEYKKCYQE